MAVLRSLDYYNLSHRRETLRKFQHHNILLAIPESSLKVDVDSANNIVPYKKALLIKPILEALNKLQY